MRMSVSTSRYFSMNPAENIPAPSGRKSILTYTEKCNVMSDDAYITLLFCLKDKFTKWSPCLYEDGKSGEVS